MGRVRDALLNLVFDSLGLLLVSNLLCSSYIQTIRFSFNLGDEEAFDKFARRTVKVTREHNDECKRLLKLMGIPYVEAPTEAEARKSD